MYQGTGELKNFQSSKSSTHEPEKIQSSKSSSHVTNHSIVQRQPRYKSDVNHLQLKSSSSVMTLITKCQSPTIKVKYKCDDLVNQVSITNSDHYLLLVDLYSIKAQSTLK